jgi:hypothetical protein
MTDIPDKEEGKDLFLFCKGAKIRLLNVDVVCNAIFKGISF